MTKPVEMTIREFLEEVASTPAIVENNKELADFAQYRLSVMDRQNKKRKSGENSKANENLAIFKEFIEDIVRDSEDPVTVKAIREVLETQNNNYSSSKITAILKVAEKKGLVVQVQPEKKSHPMRYELAKKKQQ